MPSMQQTVATRAAPRTLPQQAARGPQTGPEFVDFLGWKSIRNSLIAVHYAPFKCILLKSEPWADDACTGMDYARGRDRRIGRSRRAHPLRRCGLTRHRPP